MQKIISGLLVSSLAISSTFAGLEAIPTVSTDMAQTSVEKVGVVNPMSPNGVKYTYDADALKKMYDQKSSLIEVVCQSEDVFKNLGVDSQKIKINSLGFTRQDLDITVDSKNCALYANKTNRTQSNGTNDEKTLATAQKFVDEVFGTNGVVSIPKLGKPEITWRDNGGMMPMSMLKETATLDSSSPLASVTLLSGSTTEVKENIEVKYNSITVLFPYLVGNTAIYSNYGGGKMGVTVTVDGNGIMNVNVPLLAFKGVAKTAEKNTFAGTKTFIAQGGNNPYRGSNGTDTTVKLNAPERVLVYFDYYTPNAMGMTLPRKFISDGIRLSSTMKVDQWSQVPYEMIVSDFVIGNNSNPILMSTTDIPSMTSDSSTEKPKAPIKKRLKFKKKSVITN